MLVSMTGFSNKNILVGQTTDHPLELMLTVKSLNARFLEVNCKLPYALTHLETEIIKRFKAKLTRGTIYVTIQASNPSALKANLAPAFTMVENYMKALSSIQQRFNIAGTLTISDLIHLPHIFEFPELLVDQETAREILAALDDCAEGLIKTRKTEGALFRKRHNESIAKAYRNPGSIGREYARSTSGAERYHARTGRYVISGSS